MIGYPRDFVKRPEVACFFRRIDFHVMGDGVHRAVAHAHGSQQFKRPALAVSARCIRNLGARKVRGCRQLMQHFPGPSEKLNRRPGTVQHLQYRAASKRRRKSANVTGGSAHGPFYRIDGRAPLAGATSRET